MNTWVPTVDRFLSSWALLNIENGPDKPVTLPDGYGREQLAAHHAELVGYLEELQTRTVVLAEMRANRTKVKQTLCTWMRSFNLFYKSIFLNKSGYKVQARTPMVGNGSYVFGMSANVLHSNWERLDAERKAASLDPIVIADNISAADFLAKKLEWDDLEFKLIAAARTRRWAYINAATLVRETIYPRLLAYRRRVASQYPADHPLMLSLPRLHPEMAKGKKSAKRRKPVSTE